MSKQMKRNLVGGAGAAVLATLLVLSWIVAPFSSGGQPESVRQIVLEARDLAFGDRNPTLEFEPGERIRLVVRNNDPGVLHSITLPGLDSTVYHLKSGDEVTLELIAPQAGSFEYICPQHAPEMKGKIVITP